MLLCLNQGFGVLLEPLNLFYMAVRIYLYIQIIFTYLDNYGTPVLSCAFTIKYMFFFLNTRCNKDNI